MKAHRTVISISAFALLATGSLLLAGPLNPPAGPVASTFKTLSEVEPRIAISQANMPGDANSLFVISQPGSYYLTGNITGQTAKNGIKITSGGVTLDLNGFDMLGVAGSRDGVFAESPNLRNITVVNGSVRNWGGDGVDLGSQVSFGSRIAGVLASGNGGVGIFAGSGGTVTECSADQNASGGIQTGQGTTITNCATHSNTGQGIFTNNNCTLTNCAVEFTSGVGAGEGVGIIVGAGCSVTGCSSISNSSIGISAGLGSTVAECVVRTNTTDGILCTSSCVVRFNTCSVNGNGAGDGANIHLTGNDNRLEDNNCIGADRGIDVDGSGNILIRNTCSGNTVNNWDIVAGNFAFVLNATGSAAIVGNNGGVSFGTNDSNANFTY